MAFYIRFPFSLDLFEIFFEFAFHLLAHLLFHGGQLLLQTFIECLNLLVNDLKKPDCCYELVGLWSYFAAHVQCTTTTMFLNGPRSTMNEQARTARASCGTCMQANFEKKLLNRPKLPRFHIYVYCSASSKRSL